MWRWLTGWTAFLVAFAAYTTVSWGQAGPANRIVAVSSAVEVAEEATVPTTLLVAAGVTRLLVSVEGSSAAVAFGPCPTDLAAFVPFLDVGGATRAVPTRADLCVRGTKAGTGRVVVLGNDGSTVAIAVTVTSKTPSAGDGPLAAPTTMQVVTADQVRRSTVDPGFDLSAQMSAVAAGPDGSGVIVLSSKRQNCPGGTTRTTTALDSAEPTTTTTTALGSAAPTTTTTIAANRQVHLLVCGASQVGTYTAKFDLNGAAAGGELTVTAIRRHSAWWSLPAVLLGLGVGLAVGFLGGRAEKAAKDTASERVRQAAEKVFADIQSELAWGGPEISAMADLWAPQRWDALSHESTSTSPTPAEAGAMYARAAVCVRPLVQLWVRYWRGGGPEPTYGEDVTLASSAKADLRFGIAPNQEGDSPAKIVDRLERHAALAHVALREDTRLAVEWKTAPANKKLAIVQLRKRLAGATLDEVDDVLAPTSATVDDLRTVMSVGISHGARTWDSAIVLASPTAGPPPNPARAALRSQIAKIGAIALGLLAATVIGVAEALNPTAAWGTAADFVKMFGAAVALPSVADQARELLAGPAAKAK